MIAVSAALTISGVPFMGPIAASRVGWIDGKAQLNPTIEQMKTSDLDLIVAFRDFDWLPMGGQRQQEDHNQISSGRSAVQALGVPVRIGLLPLASASAAATHQRLGGG